MKTPKMKQKKGPANRPLNSPKTMLFNIKFLPKTDPE